jgi:hypothetical protein
MTGQRDCVDGAVRRGGRAETTDAGCLPREKAVGTHERRFRCHELGLASPAPPQLRGFAPFVANVRRHYGMR